MKEISLLTPTRGRVVFCQQMIQSVIDTVNHPERIEFIFYVDWDDPQHDEYIKTFKKYQNNPCRLEFIVAEPISVSKGWNIMAENCSGDVFKMGNDDIRYRTKGWDDVIDAETAKFPDDIYCMWFNDELHRGKMCTFPIISRKWYETLGYAFSPGIFNFFYNDTWTHDIGKRIEREHYVGSVINEHLHWTTKKSEADDTTRRARVAESTGQFQEGRRDGHIWNDTGNLRAEAAEKLKKVMNVISNN